MQFKDMPIKSKFTFVLFVVITAGLGWLVWREDKRERAHEKELNAKAESILGLRSKEDAMKYEGPMATALLVRHGFDTGPGRVLDPEIGFPGVRDAADLIIGKWLVNDPDKQIMVFYSPVLRAEQTANLIAKRTGAPLGACRAEWLGLDAYLSMTNREVSELRRTYPHALIILVTHEPLIQDLMGWPATRVVEYAEVVEMTS